MKTRLTAATLFLTMALPLGAAASQPQAATVRAELWPNFVHVEETRVSFFNAKGEQCQPIAYNGSIYLPLRAAGEWMGADVDWDQENRAVVLTTAGKEPLYRDMYSPDGQTPMTGEDLERYQQDLEHGIEPLLDPGITVTLDGEALSFHNVKGDPVYPMVFRESVYLPLRSIGELCGKQVLWYPYADRSQSFLDRVYLYDPLTPEQAEAGQVHLEQCAQMFQVIQEKLETLAVAEDLTEETFLAELEDLKTLAEQLQDLPFPDVPILDESCRGIRSLSGQIGELGVLPYLEPETYLRPEYATASWQERRDGCVDWIKLNCMSLLEARIAGGQELLNASCP